MHKITLRILTALLILSSSMGLLAQEQIPNSDFEVWADLGEQSEKPSDWNNRTNAAEDFFFTGFKTEGASQNIDFSMDGREENGFGDYSNEYEVIINPDNDNADDIKFTAEFGALAHIKMWVSGIPDIGDIEIVDSEGVVESPFIGSSTLLSMLGMAPDMSFDMLIAGSTTGEPNLDTENDPATEIIKIKITIDRNYLGVDAHEGDHFSFYPNPVQNELILDSSQQIDEVSLYNLLGQQIKNVSLKQLKGRINVSDLQSGIYIMKVNIDGKQKSYKVIKS